MEMTVPKPLKEEHAELHAELVAATKAGGKVSDAARVPLRRHCIPTSSRKRSMHCLRSDC